MLHSNQYNQTESPLALLDRHRYADCCLTHGLTHVDDKVFAGIVKFSQVPLCIGCTHLILSELENAEDMVMEAGGEKSLWRHSSLESLVKSVEGVCWVVLESPEVEAPWPWLHRGC